MAKKTKACGKNQCSKGKCKNKCAKPVVVVDAVAVAASTSPEPPPPAESAAASSNVNHAEKMSISARTFFELYSNYNTLRELAVAINGKPQTDPFPPNVKIDKVEMTFTVNDAQRTVVMTNTRLIGEVAALIGNELNSLIERMYMDIFELNHVAGAMQKAIEAAIAKPTEPTNTKPPK